MYPCAWVSNICPTFTTLRMRDVSWYLRTLVRSVFRYLTFSMLLYIHASFKAADNHTNNGFRTCFGLVSLRTAMHICVRVGLF